MRKNHLLRKQIFSIIMTLIMVVSMMPANVWADEIYNGSNVNVQDSSNTDSNSNAVNANSGEHIDHCICGKESNVTVNGHGSHSDVEFKAWEIDNALPTDEGAYYLTKDVTLNNGWQLTGGVSPSA